MRFKNDYIKKTQEYIKENNFTYAIDTMGCQMNENDSEKYSGILSSMGFTKGDVLDANIVLFNTCCIRENAENTLFGRLGHLKKRKLVEKDVYIVVVGCMTQQKHILEKIQQSYSFVDIVLGTNSIEKFPKKLYEAICENKKNYTYEEANNDIIEDIPVINKDKYKANVSIIYGCNNFCSYCIVPYVRGRERSRKPKDIIEDVKKLAKQGYKEITLLGQNVNSYGNNFDEKYTFSDLLKEVEKIDGIEIIKFMSPHPKDFKDELIETIKNSTKISKQVHLPLQSGSTKILELMNRKYTKEQFLEIVKKLREAVPEISISTDIIVGFPGETEEDFLETLDVVKKVAFDQIFMFIYSKRTGTKAASMEDNTTHQVKVDRLEKLKAVYEELLPENNEKMVGKTYKVLVEGKSKNNNELYSGRTSQNKIVVFEAKDEMIGTIQEIKIISQHLYYLKGEIV